MKVEILIPCYIDQMYPETGFSMVKVLQKLGCDVTYNDEQTCCGQPSYNAGYWDDAKAIGEKLLREVPQNRYLVIPSASCAGMIRHGYTDLFNNSVHHNRCRTMQKNTYEFSEFIVNVVKPENFSGNFPAKVTYHDSCSALRDCGIKDEPRAILSRIKGIELLEMDHTDICCGFGGSFAVKFETLSVAMTEQKVEKAINTGAEYIISTDMSCLMQLDSYIKKNNKPIKVMHLADLMAASLTE
jgi:L-lactate dehydrogenase complex protein LldE